jgi:hypothetical protein
MAKNKNLIKNTAYNFKLIKRALFFIGVYIILGALLIKTIINGFSTDSSPFGFLTVNFLEYFITIITLLVFLFSLLALFFGNRRYQRKIGFKIWNTNSFKSFEMLLFLIVINYLVAFSLLRSGLENYIIPSFLIGYGVVLSILNFSKTASLYYFSVSSFCLGILALFLGFGIDFLFILGCFHIIYGIKKRA